MMSRAVYVSIAVASLFAVPAVRAAAQPPARSTAAGVYTAEQAARGRDTYAGSCQGCHQPAVHSGAPFAKAWHGRSVWALFAFLSNAMPKNDPGTLTPDEYAQVTAYLLEINGMPPGRAELPTDSAALAPIRITPPAPRRIEVTKP